MFASKFFRKAALALFVVGPALAPAVVAVDDPLGVRALEHGIGRGTVSLPDYESEGLLAAALLGDEGSRYGLDAALSMWIPSLPLPGLAFGGVYGELFEVYPAEHGYKAYVEGSWMLVSEDTGHLDARVLRADASGELRVVGAISGKFRVALRSGEDGIDEVGAARPKAFVLAGDLGLDFVLAHEHR